MFLALADAFQAGKIATRLLEWKRLTSDPEILRMVSGDVIEFDGDVPSKHFAQKCNISSADVIMVGKVISDLLNKNIVVPSTIERKQFVSPIFPVINHDGGIRMILNLKELNNFVSFHHFKMDTIKSVLQNITPGCYMASLDLKHAYHSIKIDVAFQKYLKFIWDKDLFQYTCYPNGLSSCPRKFSKLMKVPLSHLREDNCFIIGYLDDFFLSGLTFLLCTEAMRKAINMFITLGFTIHPTKSVFEPSTSIIFLGFVIDSLKMTVSLTAEKRDDLQALIRAILFKPQNTIRTISRVIGKIVASLPAALFGPLYYRNLEKDRN